MKGRQTERATEFIRSLYPNRKRARSVLSQLKSDYDYADIQKVIRSIQQTHRSFGHHIFSAPFPRQYAEFRRPPSRIPYSSIQEELRWATAVLSAFSQEIQKFVPIRQIFEKEFLLANYDQAKVALEECERLFGLSLWLLERKCLLAEFTAGYEANAAVSAPTAAANNDWLLRFFGAFVSIRADPKLSVEDFDSRVTRTLGVYYKSRYYSEFKAYIAFKLGRPNEDVARHADYVLAAEASSPIIDRYETLLGVIVQLACAKDHAVDELAPHVSNLKKIVRDPMVDGLVGFVLADPPVCDLSADDKFMKVLDDYTVGNYASSIQAGLALLQEQPEIFSLYEVLAKAFAFENRSWKDGNSSKSISDLVGRKIMDVWAGNGSVENSRHELARISTQLPRTNLSYGLNWFCGQEQEWHGDETKINPAIVASHLVNPRTAWQIGQPEKRRDYLRRIRDRFPESPLANFEIELANAPNTSPANRSIPRIRQQWHRARALMSERDWEQASQLLEKVNLTELAPGVRALTRNRLSRARFDCFFYRKLWLDCADVVISSTLEDQSSGRSLPIRKLIDTAERGHAAALIESIDFPILYSLISTKQKDTYPAYDAFMFAVGATKPSELFDLETRFGKERLLLFLSGVCVPKVLARSPVFDSSEDVSLERIRICQFLARGNRSNADKHIEEINDLTQQLVIRRGVREVDSSKIFVDVDGLKQAGRPRWKHSFARLTELAESDSTSAIETIDTTEIIVIDLTGGGKKGSEDVEGGPLSIETVPLQLISVPFGHFKELFLDIRDQFVSSNEFGLNSYLSVRIRHGTIEGQVRSSFEAANLLSQRTAATGGSYQVNRFWQEKLQNVDGNDAQQFQKSLQSFSTVIDGIADRLKGSLITIRTEKKSDTGLFDYRFSNEELAQLFTEKFRALRDYGQFIDGILDVLWTRTHANLKQIREYISGPLKEEAYDALVNLQEQAKRLLPSAVNGEFQMTASTCLTSFQNDFQRMSDWFNVSGQTTVQHFSLKDLIKICAAVISNTHPTSHFSPDVRAPAQPIFNGNYFPAFSDIVRTLMDNTIKHSGVDGELRVTIDATIKRDVLTLTIANNLSPDRRAIDPATRLRNKYAGQDGEGDSDIIAREGGSGLHKIHKILRFDLRREKHRMEFGYNTNDELAVTLQFETNGLTV